MIHFYGGTHTGHRQHNEDCFAVDNTLGLALVADGMGGYACGEVASALARETLIDALIHHQGLTEAIVRAHYLIRAESELDEEKKGMGTTIVAAKVEDCNYELAWVGDSRAYLWDGALKQITRDHSFVESLLSSGSINLEEARQHPNRNLITQAVGVATQEGLEVSLVSGRMAAGQKLLLCSDGLVDEVSDSDIASIMAKELKSEELVEVLIAKAFEQGGKDNITVVIGETDSNCSEPAEVPFVVCTTSLDGQSIRHALPEPALPGEGVSIDADAEIEIPNNRKFSRGWQPIYWLWVLGPLIVLLVILLAIK